MSGGECGGQEEKPGVVACDSTGHRSRSMWGAMIKV
jgi:hypothetical protein